eukprot:CAMPEP_0194050702 /NCGR_PEP_ID=MMETSP0009_2-20130614/36668_1 /TAXON_ID=210454 /ORGANISM="Grammatophora oceanica, Strain CCMP 410" /LENGTH=320 /DNA_ID=CAMNT_0038697467 /DNA_START=74 /DNA_END=1039 /DNA_ORIENTATION=+
MLRNKQQQNEDALEADGLITTTSPTSSKDNEDHDDSSSSKGSCTFLLVLLANIFTVLFSPRSPVHITLGSSQPTTPTPVSNETITTITEEEASVVTEEKNTGVVSSSSTNNSTTTVSENWKVPLPILAVGYSFEGDFALHEYFTCSGMPKVQHYCCCDSTEVSYPCKTMGSCLKENEQQPNPLEACGFQNYNVFTQLESEYGQGFMSLPQDFMLELISKEYPNATLLFNHHTDEEWPSKVSNGRGVGMRYIRTFPHIIVEGQDKNSKLRQIHLEHRQRIETFAKEHPSHQLVDVNVGSNSLEVGKVLEEFIGGKGAECWK